VLSSFSLAFGGSAKTRHPHRSSSSAAPQSASHSSSTSAKKKSKKHRSKREPTQKVPTPQRISEIQSALARGGYYQGEPNGKWDANTISALQKFQSGNGLDPNGKLNALSLQKLGLGSEIAGVSAPRPVAPAPTPNSPSAAPKSTTPAAAPSSSSMSSAATTASASAATMKPPQP
jgi:hypothetical protein